ncbi:hypothetical protein ANANG_G00244550 [Anguilla anguilla]|uniref:Pleckstrin homology domain-containing family G member 5 n=1 Tax=Anguilla anguilla TaxID=7936 RepID=A0A9D3LR18_ANGAN|nr:hypothetical protein ANANG_G00244550 [Anguilla anguilla]
MFLYWKKRGAYELETLPASLAELGAERYSWSSSLDVIHDLVDERFAQEEKSALCQHPDCPDHRRAAKVCHHPDCQDLNNQSPLNLCESCDSRRHPEESDSMHFDRHPRFDLQPQGSILARNVSTRSCPPRTCPPSDLEEEEDGGSDRGDRKAGGMKLVKKKPRRRHTDDPSKECFSLKFDLSVDIDTEIVPAMKKKTLREVLGPVFERKGIELSRVNLFLAQSNTPLSLNFEAYRFGGHYLKRGREELKVEQGVKDLRSLSLPIMKPGGSPSPYILTPGSERVEHGSLGRRESADLLGQARRRKNMTEFLGDASIPSPDSLAQLGGSLSGGGAGPDSWKNRAASRFSGFFSSGAATGPSAREASSLRGALGVLSVDNNTKGDIQPQTHLASPGKDAEVDRVEQLHSKLHSYTLLGLPKVPPQLSFHHDSWEEEETNLELEESWQCLLENPESLTRRQFHQQEAIWELLQTEATYIKRLRVITDLFLCGLLNLQESGLLTEVEPSRLFSNIQDVVRLHTALWAQVMLPALEKARESRALLDPAHLHEGFQTIGSRFQPYIHYCMEEESCLEYTRNLLKENELFRIYVTWAETHKQCNRLKLTDMLAKPHQRLTKYPLLLKSVLKKTDEPATREAVSGMVGLVEGFINSVNSQMRQRQERQKLAATSSRIESYEAVEGGSEEVEKILREFSRFDLTAPMMGITPEETRELHLEGALRMKEGKESRMDVYCFLFTDLLLITKSVKRVEKVKVIRQPLLINNVVCRELKDPGSFLLIYLNEFHSAVAAYSFQANSATQGRNWIDAIYNVQNRLQKLRTEEHVRRQVTPPSADGGEGDESSNSAASSPCLPHKEQQSGSQSDGSTETLSVAVLEETNGSEDSSSFRTDLGESFGEGSLSEAETPSRHSTVLHPNPKSLRHLFCTEVEVKADMDPQCRSLSMDSAYGTLSPESLLRELHRRERPGHSEGEETEGEEAEPGEEEEEEDLSSSGSQRSGTAPSGCGDARCSPAPTACRCSRTAGPRSAEPPCEADGGRPDAGEDRLTHSAPEGELSDILRRAEAHGSRSCPCSRASSSGSDCETAPPAAPEGNCGCSCSLGDSGEEQDCREPGAGRKCKSKAHGPAQQHKKLTLAQLYKIRTTLVLNSTLTASEV